MCEVAIPLIVSPPEEDTAGDELVQDVLPAGFIGLSAEDRLAVVSAEPIETYFDVSPTPISSGQWASVYKCRQRETGLQYAAKFCDKLRLGEDATRHIEHELAALHRCRDCARIVRLQQAFETDHQLVLVMELGCGGDLQGVLDDDQVPFEADVVRFVRSLLEGLAFMHEQGLAHMDIKPQNLLLTGPFPDCDVKLCDLEISRQLLTGQTVREMLGTPDYVAPEVLRFEPITLAADVWSVGVLAYVLLTGFTPFGGDSDSETFRNIASAPAEFPDELFEDVSAAAKEFVDSCLHKQPSERPSVAELLRHRWLQPAAAAPASAAASSSLLTVPSPAAVCQPGPLRRSISKSREALSMRVSRSNLKKNISKSRDRLCDLKFGVGRSPLTLRASTSRLPDASGGRPPWRGAGAGAAFPTPVPSPLQTRKATATIAEVTTSPSSTRQIGGRSEMSPRNRRKCSAPQVELSDWRSTLRQHRKSSEPTVSGLRSSDASPDASPKIGDRTRRNSRKQSLISADVNKHTTETAVSDMQDVFKRLSADTTRRNSTSASPRRTSLATSALPTHIEEEPSKHVTNKNKMRRISLSQESIESTSSTLSADSGICVSSPSPLPTRRSSETGRAPYTRRSSPLAPSTSTRGSGAISAGVTPPCRRRSECVAPTSPRTSPKLRRASVATLSNGSASRASRLLPKRQDSAPLIIVEESSPTVSADSVTSRLACIQDEEETASSSPRLSRRVSRFDCAELASTKCGRLSVPERRESRSRDHSRDSVLSTPELRRKATPPQHCTSISSGDGAGARPTPAPATKGSAVALAVSKFRALAEQSRQKTTVQGESRTTGTRA